MIKLTETIYMYKLLKLVWNLNKIEISLAEVVVECVQVGSFNLIVHDGSQFMC